MSEAAAAAVAILGGLATLVGAGGLATSRYLRARDAAPVRKKVTPARPNDAGSRGASASQEDLEALVRRVADLEARCKRCRELDARLREVLDRLAACEDAHARGREDVGRLRREVADLASDLLEAQIEVRKTLASFMTDPPRSKRR